MLLGRQNELLPGIFAALQLGEARLRFIEALFEFGNFVAEFVFRLRLHAFDHGEGTIAGRAAAHRGEFLAASQLLDHGLGEIDVAVGRHNNRPPEWCGHLSRGQRVEKHINVTDEIDGCRRR